MSHRLPQAEFDAIKRRLQNVMYETLSFFKASHPIRWSSWEDAFTVDSAECALPLLHPGSYRPPATLKVIKGDCLKVTQALADRKMNPLLMVAGSKMRFGGNYLGGARAQEEEVCRRSSLAITLGVPRGAKQHEGYPLLNGKGIYIPVVEVVRHDSDQDYAFLDHHHRYECAVGVVSALRNPSIVNGHLAPEAKEDMENVWHTFFRMAILRGHTSVVAVAIGCGAFHQPAADVAAIAVAAARSPEVVSAQVIQEIIFAVIDDHNAHHALNPDGNFAPFARAVVEAGGKVEDLAGNAM